MPVLLLEPFRHRVRDQFWRCLAVGATKRGCVPDGVLELQFDRVAIEVEEGHEHRVVGRVSAKGPRQSLGRVGEGVRQPAVAVARVPDDEARAVGRRKLGEDVAPATLGFAGHIALASSRRRCTMDSVVRSSSSSSSVTDRFRRGS